MADFTDLPPEAPTAAPATPAAPNPDVFVLAVAIDVPGKGLTTHIPIRRPTAGDILQVGNPVVFDPVSYPPIITHHPERMSAMLYRLTGLTPPVQAKMDPNDFVSLCWEVTPFLMPRMG